MKAKFVKHNKQTTEKCHTIGYFREKFIGVHAYFAKCHFCQVGGLANLGLSASQIL